MIKSITVTNYLGDSIKLDLARPEESGFIVQYVNGLGPGKANINTTEVQQMHGSLFNSLDSKSLLCNRIKIYGKISGEVIVSCRINIFIKKKITLLLRMITDKRTIEG
jgi:hypothetical protein